MLSILAFPVLAPSAPYPGERIEQVRFLLEKQLREKEFELFIYNLGVRESGDKWWITNTIGCIGKWQFSQSTLAFLGYKNITAKKFRKDTSIFPEELQKKVLLILIQMNEMILKDYSSYIGQIVSGVVITRSGMIAAAHLGGAGSVRLFLSSNGRINNHDAYGTSIKNYMFEFSMYNF
jgi:hypothetical protein